MPIYNQVQTETITNGGGTFNLACGNSTTTRYVFSGTATLSSNWTIQPTGTPLQGMEFDIRWQAPTTIGANTITIFGRVLTEYEALNDLIITCYYNGSAWDVDVNIDDILWEPGTGSNSTTLISGGNTVSGTGALSGGSNCTSSGDYSATFGDNNITSAEGSFSVGSNNTSSALNSVTLGLTNTSSGINSVSTGTANVSSGDYSNTTNRLNTASGEASSAEGYTTIASGDFSHSGGKYAQSTRFGQWTRSSGKNNTGGSTEYSQHGEVDLYCSTTDATPEEMFLDNASERFTIANNSAMIFEVQVLAIQDAGGAGTVGDTAAWIMNGVVKNLGGTTALVDTVRYQDNTGAWGAAAQRAQDAAAATWTAAITASDANDSLVITVTGEANKTIYWHSTIKFTEIKYNV